MTSKNNYSALSRDQLIKRLQAMEQASGLRHSAKRAEIRRNHQPRRESPPWQSLLDVVEQLAVVSNYTDLMAIVRKAARHLTGADGATLVLRDNDQCWYADEDAIGPLWKGQRFPLDHCISGWVMLHDQMAVIEDIYTDPRIPHEAYRPTFVNSLSMVPIGHNKPVGAIGCYWEKSHRPSEEELRLQQALADATAVALTNIELYDQLDEAQKRSQDDAVRLEASEARFHSLFENSPVPIWVEDFSAVKARLDELQIGSHIELSDYLAKHPEEVIYLASLVRVVEVNEQSVAFFGVQSKADIWRHLPDYFDESALLVFQQEILTLVSGAKCFSGEVPIRNIQGNTQVLLLQMNIVPGFEDSWSQVLVSFFDITERAQAETERYTALERQRDSLVREVHHRIKNHLQGVSGLLRKYASANPEIELPLEQAITKVLTIAQVYGLQSRDLRAPVHLDELIKAVADVFLDSSPIQFQLPAHGQVALVKEETVPVALVINELITNATKHKQVSDQHHRVQVALTLGTEGACIEVKSGPASLPPNFDFVKSRGLGMGLELVKALLCPQTSELVFHQEDDVVVARLTLAATVLQTNNELL